MGDEESVKESLILFNAIKTNEMKRRVNEKQEGLMCVTDKYKLKSTSVTSLSQQMSGQSGS